MIGVYGHKDYREFYWGIQLDNPNWICVFDGKKYNRICNRGFEGNVVTRFRC